MVSEGGGALNYAPTLQICRCRPFLHFRQSSSLKAIKGREQFTYISTHYTVVLVQFTFLNAWRYMASAICSCVVQLPNPIQIHDIISIIHSLQVSTFQTGNRGWAHFLPQNKRDPPRAHAQDCLPGSQVVSPAELSGLKD